MPIEQNVTIPSPELTAEEDKPKPFPVILLFAAVGSAAITIVSVFITLVVFGSTNTADGGEGAGLWLILLVFGFILGVGPPSFFAIAMAGSRRNNNVGKKALPAIGVLCFLPALFVALVSINDYAGRREMNWATVVTMTALAVTALVWLVASADKVPLSMAAAVSLMAAIAITATVFTVGNGTDDFRRDSRRQTLIETQRNLYLPPREPGPTGWRVESMFMRDPLHGVVPYSRLGNDFVNDRGDTIELMDGRSRSNPICGQLQSQGTPCGFLFTTPAGHQVAHERGGGFFYEVTSQDRYIALTSTAAVNNDELALLIDSLEKVSPDEWLDRLEEFEAD